MIQRRAPAGRPPSRVRLPETKQDRVTIPSLPQVIFMKRFISFSLLTLLTLIGTTLALSCTAGPELDNDRPLNTSAPPSSTPPHATASQAPGTRATASIPAIISDAPSTPTRAPVSPLAVPTEPSLSLAESPLSPLPVPALEAKTLDAIPIYTYQVLNTYPHDPDAFTQGLIFVDGWLYEGTGLRGRSTLRKVELESGQVLQLHQLPAQFFGEGVTILGNKIFQLTWRSNVGFVYDKNSFELLQEFYYPTEGWGLTHDGEKLIMSDGTATLYFLDPVTLAGIGQLKVTVNTDPLTRLSPPDRCFPWGRRTSVSVYGEPAIGLNELEYIQGEIYANVWQSYCIARIDAQTGQLRDWIQLGGLVWQSNFIARREAQKDQLRDWITLRGLLGIEDFSQSVDVLNGIAYDAENDRLFVTGKLWPKLFEIELLETDQ